MVLALSVLTAVAWAGCDKDTDCKGDRVCESSACVEPDDGAPAPAPAPSRRSTKKPTPPRYDAATLRQVSADRAAASRGQAFGYSFGGAGALFALTGSGLGLAQAGTGVSVGVGGVGLVSLAIGGPLAAGGGTAARHGIQLLDGDRPGNGMRIAGWSCYGTGMFLGLVAIGVGVSGDSSGGVVGIGATLTATVGDMLLAADAGSARKALVERYEEVQTSQGGAPRDAVASGPSAGAVGGGSAARSRVLVAPFVSPASSGAIVGVSGVF